MKYFLKTFGCQQNVADSERIASFYEARGYAPAASEAEADTIVINTCVIRERAEEKIYGLVRNLEPLREQCPDLVLVVTGCLVGAASREPSGKMMKRLKARMPQVEFLPMEEVGFEYAPKRGAGKIASVPISNGCNNYCAYCIVPFSRGKERSRPFAEILEEVTRLVEDGYEEVLLLGQNVNSYGADILQERLAEQKDAPYILPDGAEVRPVLIRHLGRHRIPTLFPSLLEKVAQVSGVNKLSFMSSNPWDFSDELIEVIARNAIIDRRVHLPIQAGSDAVLKNMNRWYTREEYMALIEKIRGRIPDVRFTTDIIVGFPGETEAQFEDTLDMVRRVGFERAYVAYYSPRPGTAAAKMPDNVPLAEKRRRFKILDDLVLDLSGRGHLKKGRSER